MYDVFLRIKNIEFRKMKNIAIIGATGSTGKEVVRLALEANYNVTVVVRNPSNVKPQKNLTILKGDVTDVKSLEIAFKKIDYVISCFGPTNNRKIDGLLSIGTSNIVKAFELNNVKRLVFMSGFVQADYKEFSLLDKLLVRLLRQYYHESYHDKVIAEGNIRNSKLDWVIARASGLSHSKPTGKYNTGINNTIYPFTTLSYSDCALCLLDAVDDAVDEPKWSKKIINVGKK